jgi:hypothetical protein
MEDTAMQKYLGLGVVVAAAYLTGSWGAANAQTGAGRQAGGGAPAVGRTQTTSPSSLGAAANNLEQQANEAAGLNNAPAATNAAPAQAAGAAPAQATAGMPAPGTTTVPPANTYQAPVTTGTMVNPAGTGTTYPATATNMYPAGSYPGTYTGATPGYTNQLMPGMTGYNSVNPMATTMAPGYYYAGTAGMPYATYGTPAYSSGLGYPGYNTMPVQNFSGRMRRGLFGRRNRVAYPAVPYGYNTYGNAYSSPYSYSTYGTTTYYSAPASYSYGGYRY